MSNYELASSRDSELTGGTLSLLEETTLVAPTSKMAELGDQQMFRPALAPGAAIFLTVPEDEKIDLASAAKLLAGLGHAVRLEVLRLVMQQGRTGLAAGSIATHLTLAPSTLSFHLNQMVQEKILVQRRAGRHIIYTANTHTVTALCKFIELEIARANFDVPRAS